MEEIRYYTLDEKKTCVVYKNCLKEYPPHTHAEHETAGLVTAGKVLVTINGTENIFCSGESFSILKDELHSIRSADGNPYSMSVWCIKTDSNKINKDPRLEEIKKAILENPEEEFNADEMSQNSSLSKFHMIRKFKEKYGLTPHQFQIQCRIRLAQKMIEEGCQLTQVCYDTGFFDQSHFDRCFTKLVKMTPTQYKNSSSTMPE